MYHQFTNHTKRKRILNYRPGSLICRLWKPVFEKMVSEVLEEHLELNELLKESKHGFRMRGH